MNEKKPTYGMPGHEYETMSAKGKEPNDEYQDIPTNSNWSSFTESSAARNYQISHINATVGNEIDSLNGQSQKKYLEQNSGRYGTVSPEYLNLCEKQRKKRSLLQEYSALKKVIDRENKPFMKQLVSHATNKIEKCLDQKKQPEISDIMLLYFVNEDVKNNVRSKECLDWAIEIMDNEKSKQKQK